jgi:ribose transport system permease protein
MSIESESDVHVPGPEPSANAAPHEPADQSAAAPKAVRRGARRWPRVDGQVAVLWGLFLISIPASRLVSQNFPSGAQLEAIITLGLLLIVLAFGEGLVILTGGIDLSVPAIAASAAYACAWLFSTGMSPLLAIILGLVVAMVIGLVNGLGIAFLKIPSFIMTLAISTIVASALLGLNAGRPARPAPSVLPTLFGEGNKIIGLPVPLFFLIGVVVAGFAIQSLTSFGRWVYAVGSSDRAARVSGLRVGTTLAGVYVVAALFYGIGGMMLLGFSGNARLELGREYLLPAIAAVLVGGTAIAGGRGSFLGTVGGGLLLTTISVDISAANFAEGWKQVLYGAIVLGTLMLSRAAGLGLFARRRSAPSEGHPPQAVPARE